MTNEMPKGGELSLNMMYQTSGTQVNMDYSSEKDFKKLAYLLIQPYMKTEQVVIYLIVQKSGKIPQDQVYRKYF